MPLLNVRLSEEDARRAAALRKAGVPVSDVVRKAIRAEYERHGSPGRRRRKPSEFIAELFERFPDPPDAKSEQRVDTTDREAVRRYIVDKLRRRSK